MAILFVFWDEIGFTEIQKDLHNNFFNFLDNLKFAFAKFLS